MADWILNGETGYSVRSKFNRIKSEVDALGNGSSGTSGVSGGGSSGTSGSSGTTGTSGSSGTSGMGSSGTSGISGEEGTHGTSGMSNPGNWKKYKALLTTTETDPYISAVVLNSDDPYYLGDFTYSFGVTDRYIATLTGVTFTTTGTTFIIGNSMICDIYRSAVGYRISDTEIGITGIGVIFDNTYIEIGNLST